MSPDKQRRTFISYSRINKDFALTLAKELKASGFNIWFDQLDIPTGSRWDDEIEQALEECEIFMVILTPASSKSDNVKDEIGFAIDTNKRILPILLENAKVPLRLRRFQYVDFTKKDYDEGIESAKRLLRRLIEEPTIPRDQVQSATQKKKPEAEREVKKKAEDEKKPAADHVAAQKAEADRMAKQKAEDERLAKAKAETERKEKEEAEKLAAQKAEADRKVKEKAEADRIAREKQAAERLAAQKTEEERKAREAEKIAPSPEPISIPEKNNRAPLIIGAVVVGVIVLGFAVVAVVNTLRKEIPVTAATEENPPAAAQLGEDPAEEPTVQQEASPAATPTIRPATPTPEAQASSADPEGDALEESFDDDSNGWYTGTDITGSKSIEDGNYVWDVALDYDTDAWQFFNKDLSVTDFDLSVDAKRVGGTPSDLCYGLVFRSTQKDLSGIVSGGTGNYYEFEVCDDQTYLITYYDGDEWNYWRDWTDHNGIRPNDWNTLEVKVAGTDFEYYINGSKVAEFSDSNIASGNVGLSVYSYNETQGQVLFDNFTLTPHGSSEASSTAPEATSEHQSGDLLYETTFDDFDDWDTDTKGDQSEYINETGPDGLYVNVPDPDDFWFAYYDLGEGMNDVRLEADIELVGGSNFTYISLVCRSSEKGEYIFSLDTGGFWEIGKYDFENDSYEQLGYGGSVHILVAKNPNHITAICNNDELTMFINDNEIASVQDSEHTEGDIGIGVDTFDYPLAEVMFYNLEVYVP